MVAEQLAEQVENYLEDFVLENELPLVHHIGAIVLAAANMLAERLSTTPPSNMGPETMDLTSAFFNVKVALLVSLVLNILLLLLGCGPAWWPPDRALGGAASRLSSSALRGGSVAAGRQAGDAWEECETARLDVQKLEDWEGMVLHSGQKTPGLPNFTHGPLFEVAEVPHYVLPGYEEPLGTSHFKPKCWDLLIKGPTHLDPPDIWQPPGFTRCIVPLV
ncbi:hypothetical protein ABPG77_010556 [Micractinium sp. CCAP 211/92]